MREHGHEVCTARIARATVLQRGVGNLLAPVPREPMEGVQGREHLPAPAREEQRQGVRGCPLRAGVDGVNGNHNGLAKLRGKAVWSNIGTQDVRQRRENRNVIVQAPLCSPFLCRRLRRCARAQLAAAGGRRERSHCRRTLQLDGGGKGNLGPAQPAGERCRAAEPKRVSAQRSKHCVAHASTLEVDLVRAVRGSTFSNNNSFDEFFGVHFVGSD